MNMKSTTFKILLLFCSLFFFVQAGMAQEIQKSTKTEYIGGKHYYIHTVLKGQTVSALAKAYGVTEDEIYEANPDVKKVLKADAVIKIPVKSSENVPGTVHTVVQGETLSQIAQKYKVSIDQLLKANPGLSPNNIKPGQQIKIPQTGDVTESVGKGAYKLHVVQQGETLFGIARKYNVTVDELKLANPGLNETIQIGQQIRVPVKGEEVRTPDKPKDSITFKCGETGMMASYYVGLMLPLYLERAAYIDTSDDEKSIQQYSSFSFIGFYEGFMMALDSARQMGLSINLVVDDVTEDSSKVLSVLEKAEYKDLNLLIGPFFSKAFEFVTPWAKENKVKAVNPFTTQSRFVEDNPYIFKNVAEADTQAVQTINYIRKTWPGCNIFLVQSEKDSDLDEVHAYERALKGPDSSFRDYFLVDYIKEGLTGISKNMTPDKVNVVISFVHGEAGISNFIRNMSDYSFKYPIVVFGMKEWENYSSLEVDYLLNINLHIVTYSFVDYSRQSVKDFILEYRELYSNEPDEYSFAGYDIGMYFLNALRLYGKDFEKCLQNYHPDYLCTPLDFFNEPGRGYENSKFCIYRYYDYKEVDALLDPQITVEINKKKPY
jgi:LysM repeat protein/ABC-type branched-subunit amino acid transport system substrate-binding protein